MKPRVEYFPENDAQRILLGKGGRMPKSGKRKSSAKTGTKVAGKSATTGRYVKKAASEKAAARSQASRALSATGQSVRTVKSSDPASKSGFADRRHLRLVAESDRLERLIGELGNNRVAKLLSVSVSQPSRWRSGKEGMGAENQRKVIDLDYVFGRLEQLFSARQAEIWLTSYNAHLGARPVDVLRIRGAAPVIEAIDAEAQGAFA